MSSTLDVCGLFAGNIHESGLALVARCFAFGTFRGLARLATRTGGGAAARCCLSLCFFRGHFGWNTFDYRLRTAAIDRCGNRCRLLTRLAGLTRLAAFAGRLVFPRLARLTLDARLLIALGNGCNGFARLLAASLITARLFAVGLFTACLFAVRLLAAITLLAAVFTVTALFAVAAVLTVSTVLAVAVTLLAVVVAIGVLTGLFALVVLHRLRTLRAVVVVVIVAVDVVAVPFVLTVIVLTVLALETFLHLRLCGCNDAVVVLGMLQIVLCDNPVAGAHGIAPERRVFFGDMLRGTTDFYVRT